MTDDSITLQHPLGTPRKLVLLYHGFGAVPADMRQAGHRLATVFPAAWIVSIAAPLVAEVGYGRQWFPLKGITDENRMRRVSGAMDGFLDTIRAWQRETGLGCRDTVLIGASQGATMVLESLKATPELAAHAVSFGGRFAELPTRPFRNTRVHLLHGQADPVVHYHHSVLAAYRLLSLGSPVTLDLRQRVGYGLDDSLLDVAVERLSPAAARPGNRVDAAARYAHG